jgi:uncharacterized protein YqgC (DUF456 family)
MDIFLLTIGFLFVMLGLIGSFLPVLPGPLTSWLGLLILYFTSIVPMNYTFIGISLAIAIFIWVLDYIIPAIGTKRFGGSKYGVYGTTIGLLIGLFSPIPLGILLGAFLGAFIGEMLHDKTNTKRAFRASIGSLLGLITSATIKFTVAVVYAVLFFMKVWEYNGEFF